MRDRLEGEVWRKMEVASERRDRLEEGYGRSLNILEQREKKIVNNICAHTNASESLLKKARKEW